MEQLYNIWANRNPEWEIKYEDSIVKTFCDYGKGTTIFQEARGKIFGAGYEILIIAFFIGLYNKQRKPLVGDSSKRKTLGQPIKFWGNIDSKPGRISYQKIRYYIFASLIARSDVDLLALDKGEITTKKVVDILMTTMEEYINWGLDYIAEKMEDNSSYFFKDTAFLRVFLSMIDGNEDDKENKDDVTVVEDDDAPESLD